MGKEDEGSVFKLATRDATLKIAYSVCRKDNVAVGQEFGAEKVSKSMILFVEGEDRRVRHTWTELVVNRKKIASQRTCVKLFFNLLLIRSKDEGFETAKVD